MTPTQITEVLEVLNNEREDLATGTIRTEGLSAETLSFLSFQGLLHKTGEVYRPAAGPYFRLTDEQVLNLGPEIHWFVVEGMLTGGIAASSFITTHPRWHRLQMLRRGDHGFSPEHRNLMIQILSGLADAGRISFHVDGDNWRVERLASAVVAA